MDREEQQHETVSQGGYFVSTRQMYEKLEAIDAKVTVLMERDRSDFQRLKTLDKDVKWLSRTVYAIGIPIMALLGGWEAVTRLWLS